MTDAHFDMFSGSYRITFTVNEKEAIKDIENIKDCEKLSIEAKKYKEKRSLDANALLWLCLGKIAKALKTDKWEAYLLMLKRYGKFTHMIVKENAVDAVRQQWRECEVIGNITVNGQKAVQVLCYFGSSHYNTAEFSHLLDGVISEMREMGLETPLSSETKAALEMWEEQWQNG